MRTRLERLLAPRSVAVVGATERSGAYGAHVVRNLARAGFPGRLIGVNPNRRSVFGVDCLPSLDAALDALGEPVDAVVVATAASTVPVVVEDAGRLGCGGAVVLAAGFGEAGEHAAQQALIDAARRHQLPVIGPNSNGLVAVASRAPLWGDPVTLPEAPGRTALLTQSGNVGVIALAHRRGAGLHTVVSLGNAAVLDAASLLGHLAARFGRTGEIRCVAAYLEDDGVGARLASALATCAEADVRVVVLKAGRSAAGRTAGAAHTAALAGDHAVFAALVETAGGVLVRTPHELFETARALTLLTRRPGGLAVVTSSGGDAAIAADLAADVGVPLAAPTPATLHALTGLLQPTATATNPLDHTNLVWADTDAVAAITAALAADPGVGHLLYVQDQPPNLPPDDAAEWASTRAGGIRGGELAGVPTLVVATTPGQEPDGAVSGLVPALMAVRALRRPPPDPDRLRATAVAAHVVADRTTGDWLAEHVAKDLLADAGIAVPARHVVPLPDGSDPEAAVAGAIRAARDLGGPVAVKLSRPGLLHKCAVGALVLGVHGDEQVEAAVRHLAALSGNADLLIETMMPGRAEAFLAVTTDGVVPAATIGVGGHWAEAFQAVVTLPLPVTPDVVLEALATLPGAVLLGDAETHEGQTSLAALAEVAAAVAQLVLHHPLTLVELNPVVLAPQPDGTVRAVAVDAVARRALDGPGETSLS